MPEEFPENPPKTVRFHYIKGTQFRTVHVDGVIGNQTPAGGIHFATFSERLAIPQEEEFMLTGNGRLGEPVAAGRRSRGGVVREMDVDLVMSLDVARALHAWLGERIAAGEPMATPSEGSTQS